MARVKFIVFSSARSGSTWLVDVLNMQPSVEAHGELFLGRPRSRPAIAGRATFRRFIEIYGTRGLTRVPRVFTYLNKLYQAPGVVGFKLMYPQLRKYPEILAYMAIRRVRLIHLVRSNHIDVVVSEELARLTGTSHARVGTESLLPMVYLDPSTLVNRVEILRSRLTEARRVMRVSTCPWLEVSYDDLHKNELEFTRVFEFLSLSESTTTVKSNLAKRGARSHKAAITNYDEIRQLLNSTPYAELLH